jgi:Flp pilus assembly protein TadG
MLTFVSARLRGLKGERADSLVELAVFFAFLGLPLLAGMGELGLLVYDSIEISNAANAGAMYGMQSQVFAQSSSGIIGAAQAEASDFGTSLSVVPATYYACSTSLGGTQYTGTNAQSNAKSACTGGSNHALQFIQVGVSVVVTPAVQCPGLPNTFTLTGSAVMEVEQ